MITMKKRLIEIEITLLFCCVLTAAGCGSHAAIMAFDAETYVKLYDYDGFVIPFEETQLSEEDVKSIISTEMSVQEAYVAVSGRTEPQTGDILQLQVNGDTVFYTLGLDDADQNADACLYNTRVGETIETDFYDLKHAELTVKGIYRPAEIENDLDFILAHYGYKTYDELNAFIRERAYSEIIYNYVYEAVCDNSSIISYPKEIQNAISESIETFSEGMEQSSSSEGDPAADGQMTPEDLTASVESFYQELMLYKAILDKENITVTQEEIDRAMSENSIGAYEAYYQIAYEKAREALISAAVVQDS